MIGDGTSVDVIRASAQLRLESSELPVGNSFDVGVGCGGVQPVCASTPLTMALDGVLTGAFLPNATGHFLVQEVQGRALAWQGSTPHALGTYEAWIDPIVRVDPNFTVLVDGVPVPGSQLYGIDFSPNAIPEPATAPLAALGLLGLWLLRRR